MSEARTASIVEVRQNALWFGNEQVYQIRNIVRVQEQEWTTQLDYAEPATLRRRLAVVGVFGLVAMLVAAAAGGGMWAGLVFLATAFLAGRILYQLWRIYTNEPRHAVVVQTTGTPIGIFTTNDEGTAHKLFHLIVAAIEDPTHARRETINITIEGDQINQVANDSSSLIGKLVGAKA
ncbi:MULTISPECIES: DUF6232 family protein [Actinomadura]|uniref:Uncharacterized protein n=1 Tax=Actinomadura madurae TaxID=1993 RepID=A0A1I5YFD2_9ACTN|nr:DUF6232 family protein [Actinomadura madurae]SFQ42916.1 hypothetical protein SAMN04489713_1329 [Actinomadura madurae]SPT58180.1 Uncharacterised protein [Actinomadura madurae]